MNIGYLIINGVFSMLSGLLMYFLLYKIFSFRCSKKQMIIFLISFGTVNGIASTIWTNYIDFPSEFQLLKPVIALILSIYTIKFIFKTSWVKTIVSFFAIMMGMGIGNYLCPLLFILVGLDVTTETTKKSLYLYLLVNITIFLIATIITFFIPYILKLRKVKNLKQIAILLGGVFWTMIINMNTHYVEHFELPTFLRVFIFTVIFFIVAIYFVNRYAKNEDLKEEKRQQIFYNDSLKKTLQDLRRIKHDQNNHYSVLIYMLEKGKCDDARNYLNELQTHIKNVNTAIYNIENVALYAIISSEMDKAEQSGVKFDLDVIGVINTIPDIKISEFCELIGIFLDNAIEAAQLSDEKVIEMQIIKYDNSIEIKISNSCRQRPDIEQVKTDGYSTKGSSADRGHGLYIADTILNKYKFISNEISFFDAFMRFEQILKIKKA